MGEIADMMIDGTLDMHTGEYLGKGPGYPRTRDKSLPWERNRKKMSNVNRSKKGVNNFFTIIRLEGEEARNEVIERFLAEFPPPVKKDKYVHIQDNWKAFKKFVNKNITH